MVISDIFKVIYRFLLNLQRDLQLDVLELQDVVLDLQLKEIPLLLRSYMLGNLLPYLLRIVYVLDQL